MNSLQSYGITSPFGKTEECALFTVDDVLVPFTLHDIAVVDQQYTLSLWVKSDAAGVMNVCGNEIQTTTEWAKHTFVFVADSVDLKFIFSSTGTYYIYHPKLEIGNKGTDWTEAPEDVDQDISNAQSTANTAQESADNAQNDIDNTKTYTHTVLSADGGNTLAYFDFSGHTEVGTLTNGSNTSSSEHVRSSEYVKVSGGSTYVWNITDSNMNVITPTTHFYTYNSSTETYTYLSSQTANTITAPSGTEVYLRFTAVINSEESSNSTYELTLNDLDSAVASQTIDIYIGTYTTLDSYMSLDSTDYTWELTDASALKNATELSEQLNKKLYGDEENDGDIKTIQNGIADVDNKVDNVDKKIDDRQRYVQIDPAVPSISLVTSGDVNELGNKVVVNSEKISFYNGPIEGAYIGYVEKDRTSMAASKIYVTEMYPRVEDPSTANEWVGNFCWIARTNGHYSLKVVK